MKKISLALLFLLLANGCTSMLPESHSQWSKSLNAEIAELGAYNWILVTEAAYPAPGRPAAHSLLSPYKSPRTLELTLQSIDDSGHTSPRIYLTKELERIKEVYAPGMNEHRENLLNSLHGRTTQSLPSQSLESLLRTSKNGNRVLVIKSQTALPYTSIYIELESGYWSGESETALRKKEP